MWQDSERVERGVFVGENRKRGASSMSNGLPYQVSGLAAQKVSGFEEAKGKLTKLTKMMAAVKGSINSRQ